MKATELRIGNYIIFNGVETQLIAEDFKTQCRGLNGLEMSNIKPIILTSEWIQRLGFLKSFEIWNKYTFNEFNSISEFEDSEFSYLNLLGFIKRIKYVHELQNLFFALNGEELTFNY